MIGFYRYLGGEAGSTELYNCTVLNNYKDYCQDSAMHFHNPPHPLADFWGYLHSTSACDRALDFTIEMTFNS